MSEGRDTDTSGDRSFVRGIACVCGHPLAVRLGGAAYRLPPGLKAGDESNSLILTQVEQGETLVCEHCQTTTPPVYMIELPPALD
jgi:hypothetical protein